MEWYSTVGTVFPSELPSTPALSVPPRSPHTIPSSTSATSYLRPISLLPSLTSPSVHAPSSASQSPDTPSIIVSSSILPAVDPLSQGSTTSPVLWLPVLSASTLSQSAYEGSLPSEIIPLIPSANISITTVLAATSYIPQSASSPPLHPQDIRLVIGAEVVGIILLAMIIVMAIIHRFRNTTRSRDIGTF